MGADEGVLGSALLLPGCRVWSRKWRVCSKGEEIEAEAEVRRMGRIAFIVFFFRGGKNVYRTVRKRGCEEEKSEALLGDL